MSCNADLVELATRQGNRSRRSAIGDAGQQAFEVAQTTLDVTVAWPGGCQWLTYGMGQDKQGHKMPRWADFPPQKKTHFGLGPRLRTGASWVQVTLASAQLRHGTCWSASSLASMSWDGRRFAALTYHIEPCVYDLCRNCQQSKRGGGLAAKRTAVACAGHPASGGLATGRLLLRWPF